MSSYQSQLSRVSGALGATHPARVRTLVVLPLLLALAIVPVLASLALFSLLSGSNARAFDVPYFTVTSNTKQAAAHPDVMVSLGRSGGQDEDIKNIVVDLPPGLLGNPEAVPSKCSRGYFNLDWCSNSQQVGTISTDITAMGILPLSNVDGGVWVLTPSSTAAVTLGIVLRPIGSQIGIINKSWITNDITVRTNGDYGLKNSILNVPRYTAAVLFLPVPITLEHQELLLQGKAGKYKDGKPFMINSSSCAPGTATLTATSYQNVVRTRTTGYTSTGCENVSADSSFSQSVTNNTADAFTGGPIVVAQDQSAMTIQRSTIEDVVVTFPQGTSLNFDLLGSLTGCTSAQFAADTCPAGSKIGKAQASVPYLPPDFTGDVYSLDPIGSTLNLGVILRGPRTIKARFTGQATVVGQGTESRVVATVDGAPQFPLNSFRLEFTLALLRNPDTCGPQTVSADIKGHNGSTVTRTSTYTTINCPPDTTIDSGPGEYTNDQTPTFGFSASLAGSSFKCSVDNAAYVPCSTGYTVPTALNEGPHNFFVKACLPSNASICDKTPAEYWPTGPFYVDLTAPGLTVSTPTEGATIPSATVLTTYTADLDASLACKIDTSSSPSNTTPDQPGTYAPCSSVSSHSFAGVPKGPATVWVKATDPAGNITEEDRNVTVDPPSCPLCSDTSITAGPRNGLNITKRNPSYSFVSVPAGAPKFECSVDAGTWNECSSGDAIPDVAALYFDEDTGQADPASVSHQVCVRSVGDIDNPGTTTDPTPDCATFDLVDFAPTISVDYLNNTNNSLTDYNAGSHPDVEIQVDVPGGQPDDATFELPNGFWGSLAAAPRCSQADVADGACSSTSKVGTAELTVRTDDNATHTLNSDVYLAEGSGGIANLALDMPVVINSVDYGSLREDAQAAFSARYVLNTPTDITDVRNPRGMNTAMFDLPTGSTNETTLDSIEFNVDQLKLHIDGDTGLSGGNPLVTAPSNCSPLSTVGYITDKELEIRMNGGAPDNELFLHDEYIDIPYQAQNCASLAFNPNLDLTFTDAGISPGGDKNVAAKAELTLPANNSTIKRGDITIPYSIQPQYDGLTDECLRSSTRLHLPGPGCNDATTKVGTAEIETPLLDFPLKNGVAGTVSKVYLEDSGAALPNLYVYVYNADLDLNVRLRFASRTPTTPWGESTQVQFLMNALPSGNATDLPDIPISKLTMDLPGSSTYGPIAKYSTDCYQTDNSAIGTFTAWSGATANYSDSYSFPGCPNGTTPSSP